MNKDTLVPIIGTILFVSIILSPFVMFIYSSVKPYYIARDDFCIRNGYQEATDHHYSKSGLRISIECDKSKIFKDLYKHRYYTYDKWGEIKYGDPCYETKHEAENMLVCGEKK